MTKTAITNQDPKSAALSRALNAGTITAAFDIGRQFGQLEGKANATATEGEDKSAIDVRNADDEFAGMDLNAPMESANG